MIRQWRAASTLREWTAAGGEARATAQRCDRPDAYAHAASYYGAALALVEESDGLVDESAPWARQRECWDRTVLALGGQPVAIPYEETTLPGFFISAGDGRRPVADVLSLRPGVDVARMAIVGLEMGGFGVARVLVGERRFAAALLVPGILDAGRPWTDRLPDGARAALLEEDPGLFDRELQMSMSSTGRSAHFVSATRSTRLTRRQRSLSRLTAAAGRDRRLTWRGGWDRLERSSPATAPRTSSWRGSTLCSDLCELSASGL